MGKEMPFGEDIMTLILGISPEEPGQHGRVTVPMPTQDAIGFIVKIKDMCEEFLSCCGECENKPEVKPEENPDNENKPKDEKVE